MCLFDLSSPSAFARRESRVFSAVEACLSHGLKRRTLGLFKTSSTTALIHKVGKSYEPASNVSKIVQEIEATDLGR
ncbi:hypothetical protein SK128_017894 [Halocaridina rubra]|uniref:RUN domain-containing protein n=1 Tax=Halocaridina rubra TaxID=373956 RepID=A0AAN8WUL0_HALRR